MVLTYGVMVTQLVLVQSFKVRVLVGQHLIRKPFQRELEGFFCVDTQQKKTHSKEAGLNIFHTF